nr:competence type IV pilus minor pilin ComGF [Vagococcus fluvialis]
MIRNPKEIDYQGFTLIECLISLVVLMGLLLFLQPFLVTLTRIENHLKKNDYLELQIGKIQMEKEMMSTSFIKVDENKIYYNGKDRETIIFEQYNQMIRKTSSIHGHQPIITGIKEVLFTDEDGWIRMEVTTLEEENYCYFFFY